MMIYYFLMKIYYGILFFDPSKSETKLDVESIVILKV